MGLFKRVSARAGRPRSALRATPVPPHPAERVLVSVPGSLLPADERSTWRDRVGGFSGFGPRNGGPVTHFAGASDSAARSVPRDLSGPVSLTLTDRRLVVSAEGAPGMPHVEVAAFDRADVRWIARTGRSDASGVHVRCSFADESFFDVSVPEGPCQAFLGAAAELAG